MTVLLIFITGIPFLTSTVTPTDIFPSLAPVKIGRNQTRGMHESQRETALPRMLSSTFLSPKSPSAPCGVLGTTATPPANSGVELTKMLHANSPTIRLVVVNSKKPESF